MPSLIALGPPNAGEKFPINFQGTTIIGRDAACDIVLPKRSLSRRHARIAYEDGRFTIEDCGSTNGTYVNGQPILKQSPLQDGDVINLHDVPFAFAEADSLLLDDDEATVYADADEENPAETVDALPIYAGTPGSRILQGRLDGLISAARHLGSSLDASGVPQRIMEVLFVMFPQSTLVEVHLVDGDDELRRVAQNLSDRTGSTVVYDDAFDPQVVDEVFTSGQGVIHTRGDGAADSILDGDFASTICVPIAGPAQRGLGVVVLETDDPLHPFHRNDLDLVSAVGVLAGQALGFSRAHQILVKHEHNQRHLETARKIQLGMVQHSRPRVDGYRFADYYMPAERVGGDYYFYETLPDKRVILGIADASGKGLGAAMAVARFAGEVRFRIATSATLKAAMSALNNFMAGTDGLTFITCCVCVLDPARHTLTVVNAGHLPPLRKRTGQDTIEPLDTPRGGLPLGIDPASICHPVTFSLEPGDRILLFTDGVTEAMNSAGELYRSDRLQSAMQSNAMTLSDFVNDIVKDIDTFRGSQEPSDDTCIIACERLAVASS